MEKVLRQINQASLKFLSSQTLHEVYKTIVDEALKLVDAEYGTIFLHENGELKNVFSSPGFEDLIVRKRGYTYEAFKKNKPLLLQDDKILSIHPVIKKMKVKSILFIPLSYEDKSIGVLSVRSTASKQFSRQQLEVLHLFGSMASLAIQKTQLSQERTKIEATQEQSKQVEQLFEKINKAGLTFLTSLTYSEALQVVIKQAVHLLNADWGGLYLAHKKGYLFEAATYPEGKRLFTPRRKGNTYKAFMQRKTIIVQASEIASNHPELKDEQLRSTFCIPLSFQNKSIGTLTIVSRQAQKFTHNQEHLLKIFGSYATLAIRKGILLDQMKEALEVRNLFIAMAAHELRTPITTINGYAQLLRNKMTHESTPQAKWVEQLHWETTRLTKLVNELLEVNRIKAGLFEYNLQESNIRTIIERALNTLKFTNPERQVEFVDKNPTTPSIIIADFDKILQVLINTLENAAKFSHANSRIIIELETKSKYIKLSVQDFGKGIKEKDLTHLFEEFYKGYNPGTEKGMGLGLFISKNIITQHHGDINIYSQEGKGTRVEIKLPKLQATQKTHKAPTTTNIQHLGAHL